jgi:hypothetical protein
MNSEGGSSFELPPQPQVPETGEQPPEQAVEQQHPASQEAGVGKRAPQPGSTAVADDTALRVPALPHTPTIPGDEPALVAPKSPLTAGFKAHDGDQIEPQWIGKTKEIIAKTTDDPHKQKEELSRVKADYIHKRFNKIIKTDEAAA